MNSIDQYNITKLQEINQTKIRIDEERKEFGYTKRSEYIFIEAITNMQLCIDMFLKNSYPEIDRLPCLIHRIDRSMYGADLTIKFDTSLVRTLGKSFASEFVPTVVERLKKNKQSLGLVSVEQKWIYINCTLDTAFWWTIGEQILSLGNSYGDIDLHAWLTAIAEYSSPNAAKHLHAGHVRSTVIWYVLSNIYEHAGYTVHRMNHINDRGGFGQLIEGWKRRHDLLYAQWLRDNDLNYQIYTIWRQAEKISKQRNEADAQSLSIYFSFRDQAQFQEAFLEFQISAITAFFALEWWDADAFGIWKEILTSSLVEFDSFYKKLDISHDYTIGESFYEKIGRNIIHEEGEKTVGTDTIRPNNIHEPTIVTFTKAYAETYIQSFDAAHPDIDPLVRDKKHEEINADIDAKVVLLDNRERFVVLRSDGGSIYATRDIGCLRFRTQTRDPALIMYEVGQEQEDHFQKLFETAEKLGRLTRGDGTKTRCLHIAHWFYVDATTKKKLSSRAGASNVHTLIDSSIAYFQEKYTGNEEFSPEEVLHNARTLGIASIIINDISKSRMDPVLVDEDIHKTIQWFEQSGGAYLIYTICRAKSLLKKATVERTDWFQMTWNETRTDQQISLLQQCSELPLLLEKAGEQNEPSVIVQYAYHLTQSFNTMYGATDRMIDDAQALQLTACYIQVMNNVLRICNIEPLERM